MQFAGEADHALDIPESEELQKHMPYIGTHEQMPGEAAIRDILAKMGKTAPEQELNCGSCEMCIRDRYMRPQGRNMRMAGKRLIPRAAT